MNCAIEKNGKEKFKKKQKQNKKQTRTRTNNNNNNNNKKTTIETSYPLSALKKIVLLVCFDELCHLKKINLIEEKRF